MKNIIELNHPLITHKLAILRDKKTGTKEFRELVEEIGMFLCYEALKDIELEEVEIQTPIEKYKTGSIGKEKDYITREGVFRHMWMNTELTDDHKKYIYDKYSNTWELHCCIKEFRNIFKKRNVPLLYLFVEKYSKSSIKALKSFADGLKRDIDAVENAVAYNFSNSFVEGTNSRLKMIKRSMYGRCGKQLLEAKLRYTRSSKNG